MNGKKESTIFLEKILGPDWEDHLSPAAKALLAMDEKSMEELGLDYKAMRAQAKTNPVAAYVAQLTRPRYARKCDEPRWAVKGSPWAAARAFGVGVLDICRELGVTPGTLYSEDWLGRKSIEVNEAVAALIGKKMVGMSTKQIEAVAEFVGGYSAAAPYVADMFAMPRTG